MNTTIGTAATGKPKEVEQKKITGLIEQIKAHVLMTDVLRIRSAFILGNYIEENAEGKETPAKIDDAAILFNQLQIIEKKLGFNVQRIAENVERLVDFWEGKENDPPTKKEW